MLAFVLTVIVIGYYVYKTDNYGGWTNGPRWLMWLTPLLLLALLPVADYLGNSCWGRIFVDFARLLGLLGELFALEPLAASLDL